VRAEDSYPQWAAAVAQEEGVAFIDLYEQWRGGMTQLGPDAVDALFADAHTHTSRAGAELNAQIVAEALRQLDPMKGLRD
jgi:lysophospholipase L1-like esterase